ncbi:MAG: hypothetical protein QOK39_1186 [Acidimicrobiaceae bacterium]|jgi:hypothetical protein|nr:hypothetical protein [Acidimicrobiaceae bacterium]
MPSAATGTAAWQPLRRSRYQVTETPTKPWETEPNLAKVDLARSTTRPTTNGPRETTLQVTEIPAALVTVMTAPMGASLLAQVPAAMSSQLATPWVLRDVAAPRAAAAGVTRDVGARGGLGDAAATTGAAADFGTGVVGGVGGDVVNGARLAGTAGSAVPLPTAASAATEARPGSETDERTPDPSGSAADSAVPDRSNAATA